MRWQWDKWRLKYYFNKCHEQKKKQCSYCYVFVSSCFLVIIVFSHSHDSTLLFIWLKIDTIMKQLSAELDQDDSKMFLDNDDMIEINK